MKLKDLHVMGDLVSAAFRALSGEFLLKKWANSGTVVFARIVMGTSCVYGAALCVKEFTDPNSVWCTFRIRSLLTAIYDTLPWIGAIFAGVYVAFYSRFSSQWTYLAGLYNQILQSEAAPKPESEDAKELSRKAHALWWAGFIEDALELHLATKPMFATIIRHLLTERHEVRSAFGESVPGGESRASELLIRVEEVYKRTEEKWRKRAGT